MLPSMFQDVHADQAPAASRSRSTAKLGPDFIADAAEQVAPAVVNLTAVVATNRSRGHFFAGGGYSETDLGTGSGFIISSDGFIVTNAHVVAKATDVRVTMQDGTVLRGKVHSRDILSDLALVKVDAQGTELPTARIGKSSAMRPGQWVVALGSPLTLQNTVTAGIVSAVARQASELGLPQLRAEYIQTDAAINRGNSGGPLVNLAGEVVGVNTMKVAGAGISFAIPIDTAWEVVQQLRRSGRVVRPYLGFRMVAITPQVQARERSLAQRNDPHWADGKGVMVVGLAEGSPAQQAGLQPGDVIVSFDGRPVHSTSDIHSRLGSKIGRKIPLEILRPLADAAYGAPKPAQHIKLSVITAENRRGR